MTNMAVRRILQKLRNFPKAHINDFRTIFVNFQRESTRTFSSLSSCSYCQVKAYQDTERNENQIEQKTPKLRKEFINLNPRNPEYFGLNKPRGYSTQYDRRDFYNKWVSIWNVCALVKINLDPVPRRIWGIYIWLWWRIGSSLTMCYWSWVHWAFDWRLLDGEIIKACKYK